jgi:mlo protein
VVFIIGTKLQHVIATLALENMGVPGPLVAVFIKPRDQLFWFNRPKMLLSVIHLILFDTAFEFAAFLWHVVRHLIINICSCRIIIFSG